MPIILERLKQKVLLYILQQSFVKEYVYVFRDAIQLEFLGNIKIDLNPLSVVHCANVLRLVFMLRYRRIGTGLT